MKTYSPSELTDAENYALCYAMALLGGPKSKAHKAFRYAIAVLDQKKVPGDERRRTLQEGLNGLAAKEILSVKKNGEGDWEPDVLHLERLHTDLRAQMH